MEAQALYVRDGDAFVGTELTQGGWDPDAANGGAALALLGHCLDDVPTLTPMAVSRLTADLVRPVPIGRRLHVEPTVLREGKKIQVVLLRLLAGDVEHVRLTALRTRAEAVDLDEPLVSTTDARPADGLTSPDEAFDVNALAAEHGESLPGFLRAVDFRRARTLDRTGFGCWVRLHAAVVAGEPRRPTALLACSIDFANLIGMDDHPVGVTMINPDVSAHVLRPPVDGWIAVTGDTRFEPSTARGVSTATLSDAHGVFALASTSQLIQRRPA